MTTPDSPQDKPRKRTIRLAAEPAQRAAASPASRTAASRNADALNPPFVICLAVGTVLAIAGHFPGLGAVGLLGPVIMTALYPFWGGSLIRNYPSLRERLGDNAYYLGFIFTQVALFVTFAVPVLVGQRVEGADVMRGFGVAIGASMIGLLSRTLIMQTSHTAAENADIVEQEVESAAREAEALAKGVSQHTQAILADLRGVAQDLGESRARFGGEMRQWVDQMAATLGEFDTVMRGQVGAAKTGARRVAEAAEAVEADMTAARGGLTTRLDETIAALAQLQQGLESRMTKATKSVGASASDFREGMVAVVEMQNALRGQITDATGVIQSAAGQLSAGMSALKGLTAVDELVTVLDQRAGRVGESVDQLSRVISEAAAQTREASDRGMAEIGAAARHGAANIHDRADQAALTVEAAGGEALEATRQAGTRAVAALGDDLQKAVQALETVLADFRRDLERVRV